METVPHINKVVVKSNIETPVMKKSLHYVFISKLNKGNRKLEYGLYVIQAPFEQHNFPSSFKLDKTI